MYFWGKQSEIIIGATAAAVLTSCAAGPEDRAATPRQPFAADMATEIRYFGLCDGSAVARLNDGNLIVANDENNVITTYPPTGGQPISQVNLNKIAIKNPSLLVLPDSDKETGAPKEIDIEAGVRVDNKIWWIGSHGLNKKAKVHPNRRTFFATNQPTSDLLDLSVIEGRTNLIDSLLANPSVLEALPADIRDRPPKKGGLNIEGLAQSEDGLLVGFRAPLDGDAPTKGRAYIVEIRESKSGEFETAKHWKLDLEDRGIRDIARNSKGYLIIAGPVETGGQFALYSWDGENEGTTLLAELGEYGAEALVDMGDRWLIFSDDGGVKRSFEQKEEECGEVLENTKHNQTAPRLRLFSLDNIL